MVSFSPVSRRVVAENTQRHKVYYCPLLAMRTLFTALNTLRTGSFKLFKRPLPGFLTIFTL